jgi:hypothetical protein
MLIDIKRIPGIGDWWKIQIRIILLLVSDLTHKRNIIFNQKLNMMTVKHYV